MSEHKSPIERLGYFGWNQYSIFKHHLMLPPPYLKAVVRKYRTDLTEAPITLPSIIEGIDKILWENMNETERIEQQFKAKGIPVPYLRSDDTAPAAGVKVTNAYEMIMADVKKFISQPMTLYFQSDFETSALKAASSIIKQAIREGVDARMLYFGKLLDEVKKWDDNNEVEALAEKTQLLCLHMVGKEYTTEFSQSVLESILARRYSQGKTTIISTHLDIDGFKKRYGFTPQAVILKFEDEKITKTVDSLLAFMRKG